MKKQILIAVAFLTACVGNADVQKTEVLTPVDVKYECTVITEGNAKAFCTADYPGCYCTALP